MERTVSNSVIRDFENFLHSNEKSENTIEKYLRDVKAFCGFVGTRKIDKSVVTEFKSYLAEKYEITSANSMIAAVNAFLKFTGLTECCIRQFKVQKKVFRPEEKELTKAEYMRLVNTAKKKGNERLNLILQTICGTGIRVGELRFITVEAAKCSEATVSLKGKTRSVFIVKELKKKLLLFAQEQNIKSGMIFVTRTGKAISRTNIWREMKALCKEANVNPQKVFPHNLRHLFARAFYGIEKDIAKLADILGHSNINTTRIYIISTGAEHRKKMENMRLII